MSGGTWRNWAGNGPGVAGHGADPTFGRGGVAAVRQAAEQGLTLRAAGTGHSFTPLVATDGVLLRPEGLTGLLSVGAGNATVAAGSMLHDVNVALHARAWHWPTW